MSMGLRRRHKIPESSEPSRGKHEKPGPDSRRSWSLAAIIVIIAALAGAVTVIVSFHRPSARPAAQAVVGVETSPAVPSFSLPSYSPLPFVPAPPKPKPARTHKERPRIQIPMPTGVPGDWILKFDDEFNSTSLDTTKWSTGWFGSGITPPVNSKEEDCYDPAQVAESGGSVDLTIVKKSEDCGISDPVYTTGLVSTEGKFNFTYGFVEARVWLPAADGNPSEIANWPAVWADGENWPEDGEIDIVEGLEGPACAHFHGPADPQGLGAGSGGGCPNGNYADGWHTFAANWEPGIVTYYYDGVDIGSITSGITSAPMFVILDYADGQPFQVPATMKVDYVRVWQHP